MRYASFAALVLAGCTGEPPGEMTNGAAAPKAGEPDNRIECQVGDMQAFERVCTLRDIPAAAGRIVTVRYPDGGFRRFIGDNGSVTTADGAERAIVTNLPDGRIEVTVGEERFRLPVAVTRR